MKSILLVFENHEFELLKEAKGKTTWHQFVLDCAKRKLEEGQEDFR